MNINNKHLKFFSQSSIKTRSMMQKTIVDWNNSVNQFPMSASEQIINVVEAALQPVTQAHWQYSVNVYISRALHCTDKHTSSKSVLLVAHIGTHL